MINLWLFVISASFYTKIFTWRPWTWYLSEWRKRVPEIFEVHHPKEYSISRVVLHDFCWNECGGIVKSDLFTQWRVDRPRFLWRHSPRRTWDCKSFYRSCHFLSFVPCYTFCSLRSATDSWTTNASFEVTKLLTQFLVGNRPPSARVSQVFLLKVLSFLKASAF